MMTKSITIKWSLWFASLEHHRNWNGSEIETLLINAVTSFGSMELWKMMNNAMRSLLRRDSQKWKMITIKREPHSNASDTMKLGKISIKMFRWVDNRFILLESSYGSVSMLKRAYGVNCDPFLIAMKFLFVAGKSYGSW